VADKPAGLLVHPTHSCLRNNLIHLVRAAHPGVPLALAHRLDRDTSGVIVLTKTVEAARALAGQFERREIEKTYLAAVQGRVEPVQARSTLPWGSRAGCRSSSSGPRKGERAQHARTDFPRARPRTERVARHAHTENGPAPSAPGASRRDRASHRR
jgi:23S rRNA-/tRNA-specific pseudouridylate synthase